MQKATFNKQRGSLLFELINKTNVRKTLPFSNRVWYHITKPNIRSENMFDIIKEETDYDKYSKYHTGNEKKKSKP